MNKKAQWKPHALFSALSYIESTKTVEFHDQYQEPSSLFPPLFISSNRVYKIENKYFTRILLDSEWKTSYIFLQSLEMD